MSNTLRVCALALFVFAGCSKGGDPAAKTATLLHVSYDPTREFFADINPAFQAKWKQDKGESVEIRMSHGGSGTQARAVIDGLEADVVSLALGWDIDALATKGQLLPADWRSRGPAPWFSTIVMVVRKGNPKGIKDFDDLVREDVTVVAPNPKTSGGARWIYLAAWGVAAGKVNGDQAAKDAASEDFVRRLYKRIPVLDAGARGASTTFVRSGLGDVLLTWENEAYLLVGQDPSLQIITPRKSIRAEPPITFVDKNVERHKTLDVAKAYVAFVSSEAGQKIASKHHFRTPGGTGLPEVELFTIEEISGDWAKAHERHFADGAAFDRMQAASAKQ